MKNYYKLDWPIKAVFVYVAELCFLIFLIVNYFNKIILKIKNIILIYFKIKKHLKIQPLLQHLKHLKPILNIIRQIINWLEHCRC